MLSVDTRWITYSLRLSLGYTPIKELLVYLRLKSSVMAPVVGYWDIRGLGEPVRTLLHYVGVDFEDKRYPFGDLTTFFTTNEWVLEKDKLGLEFPNIPYYIDGDTKITQTLSIMRYLAKKHGLQATNEVDEIRANTLEQIAMDIMNEIIRVSYYQDDDVPDEFKKMGEQRLLGWVKNVSDSLKDDEWLVGNKLTYVDFLMVEWLDKLIYLHPNVVTDYPNIAAYIKRLEALPGVQKYMQGGKYKIWPFFSPAAKFGGTGDAPKRTI